MTEARSDNLAMSGPVEADEPGIEHASMQGKGSIDSEESGREE
jgi:hypothetical protein